MRKIKDILDVRSDINDGYLEVKIQRQNILLVDKYSGEAVKIGEIKKEYS